MAYEVLARKYRPQDFSSVVGQEPIVTALRNALTEGRIAQAYLFSGIRGVGKTSVARILAKALNCEKGPGADPCNECLPCREITRGSDLDALEIDAATYSKVEQVRELTESLKYRPARDRYKVVTIDEIHRLSRQAFDALLKIVEEPPSHLVFIFATTEAEAVPVTILSRCQEFRFRRVPARTLAAHLRTLADAEKIEVGDQALRLIARAGDGSVRDAVALLDQMATYGSGSISDDEAARILGGVDHALFRRLLDGIVSGRPEEVSAVVAEVEAQGWDPRRAYGDFLGYCRDALHLALGVATDLPGDEAEALAPIAQETGYENLLRLLHLLLAGESTVRFSESGALALEIAWLRAAEMPKLVRVEAILGRGGGGAGEGEGDEKAVPRRGKSAAGGGRVAAGMPRRGNPSGDGPATSGGARGEAAASAPAASEAAPAHAASDARSVRSASDERPARAGSNTSPAAAEPNNGRPERKTVAPAADDGASQAPHRPPAPPQQEAAPIGVGAASGAVAHEAPRTAAAAVTGKAAPREAAATEPGAETRAEPGADVRTARGAVIKDGREADTKDERGADSRAQREADTGTEPGADPRARPEAGPGAGPGAASGLEPPEGKPSPAPAAGEGLARFLEEVSRSRQALAAHIREADELTFCDGVLEIHAPTGDPWLNDRLLRRDANKKAIARALAEVWGPEARWKLVARERRAPRPPEERDAALQEALDDPRVQAVLDIFGGTVESVRESGPGREAP